MYLQVLLVRFQNVVCMMEGCVSPANAWEMAAPERKGYMKKSRRIPASAAYDFRSSVIWAAESGEVSWQGPASPFLSVIVGDMYPFVTSYPTAVPIWMYCLTARTGHTANDWLSYATVRRWPSPSLIGFPH